MMDVSKYIAEFLRSKGKVSLPGLGSFHGNYSAARFRDDGLTLLPPQISYSFHPEIHIADNGLVAFIAGREHTAMSLAEKEVEEFVEECHYVINKGKRLEITGVGLLFQAGDGSLIFEQDMALAGEGDYFGLPEVTVRKASKSKYYGIAKIIMAAFIITALVLGGIYTAWISGIFHARWTNTPESPAPQALSVTDSTTSTVTDTFQQAPPDTTPSLQAEPDPQKTTPAPVLQTEGPRYYIVAGCFRREEGAETLKNKLIAKGFDARIFGKNKQGLTLVSYASYATHQEAVSSLKKVMEETDPKAWLLKY